MTSPLILFTRSLADRLALLPALTVTGTLPSYSFDVAYTGRLQINNAIGDCTVEVLPGSQLPDGYRVWVDNATHEVVVDFPAYTPSPVSVPVQNGGMEEGPAGVSCGAGWKVGQYPGLGTITGAWSAAYTGSGTSTILWPRERVNKGDSITASIDFRQGASDAGAVGGSVIIEFFDLTGAFIRTDPGNGVWNSKPATQVSTVTASAPADGYAAMGASGTRKRQNKPLYVDNARWNLVTTAGVSSNVDLFLHIRVRDSAGRVAEWSGWIYGGVTFYDSAPISGTWPWKVRANTNFIIGAAQEVSGAYTNNQGWFHGYIDSYRITKGVARYATSSYPIPTADFGDATSDPHYSNVVLLLRMQGANGSTSFVDEKGHVVTAAGGVAMSVTQSKFGGSAAYFNGSSTYLNVEMGADCDLGNAWTMDAWIWLQDTANVSDQYNRAIFGYGPLSLGANDTVWFISGNNWIFTQYESGGIGQPSISQNLAPYAETGRWAFVSICFDGANYWMHQDGKLIAGTSVLTYTQTVRDYVDESGSVYVDESSTTYQGV